MSAPDAETIINALDLKPHPEGGFYRETFRDSQNTLGRAHSTAIYYLLREGERSHWHRVDAAEIWHWYAGSPLELRIANEQREVTTYILGAELQKNERPQIVVPPNAWQSARTLGDYTLVGCTVAPGFEFSKFEIAPKGWTP